MSIATIIALGEIATGTKLILEHGAGFLSWLNQLSAWVFFFWFFTLAGSIFCAIMIRAWIDARFDKAKLDTLLETDKFGERLTTLEKMSGDREREFHRFRDSVIQYMNAHKSEANTP